jgi:hypothetical protein
MRDGGKKSVCLKLGLCECRGKAGIMWASFNTTPLAVEVFAKQDTYSIFTMTAAGPQQQAASRRD